MSLTAIAIGGGIGYTLGVVGILWLISRRPPPSLAEIHAENAAQMAAIRRWKARQAYRAAKASGDTRAQHQASKAIREATNAELRLVVSK